MPHTEDTDDYEDRLTWAQVAVITLSYIATLAAGFYLGISS